MSRVPVILLKVLSGPDHGQEKRFSQYCVRLGRDYRNDFVLSDRFVSGRHGKLVWESGALVYYDLQSRHGTAVSTVLREDGQMVEKSIRLQDQLKVCRHHVGHGAQLLLGSTLLHLTLESKTKGKDEDTFEEQASVHSGEELSLGPSSMGELTASHSPVFDNQDANSSASFNSLRSVGQFVPTHDFLPATSAPPTSTRPPSYAPTPKETLLYHEPFRPFDETSNRPPAPHREDGTLPDDVTLKPPKKDAAGLPVPTPGPIPSLPASALLSPTMSAYTAEAGGALSEHIRQGLTETLTDVDVQHLLVGSRNRQTWNATQPSIASFRREDISIDPFPDEDISKYATSSASSVSLSKQIDKQDPRMEMLFQLTSQLNQLNHIDDILSLIVDATFDTLKAAQFFAICLMDDEGELIPYLSRVPSGSNTTGEKVTLSQSLLAEVAEKREAVLFVRDRVAKLSQSIIDAEIWSCMCAPLIGQKSLLGVMLIDTRKQGALFTPQDLNLFSILASSAAFSLERAQLTGDIVRMFEGFVEASVTAIEARDPTTAGHSQRVATYTLSLAEAVNEIQDGDLNTMSFTREELVELRYAALLHDMGKVGVRESVLNKASRLTDETMSVIHQRFETFKAFSTQVRSEQLLQKLLKDKRPPDPDELQVIKEHQEKLEAELRDTYKWINRIRFVEALQPEDIERIDAIAKRDLTLGDHQKAPLLLAQELDDLRIRRGTLNDDEWKNMRSHAALSESYLERIPWSHDLRQIPCIAGAHHEKIDGSGYPKGIKGEALLPQVRILTIADIFDALTAWDRPYRKATSIERALSILFEEAESGKLDKRLVGAFSTRVVPKLVLPQQQRENKDAPPASTGEYSIFMPGS